MHHIIGIIPLRFRRFFNDHEPASLRRVLQQEELPDVVVVSYGTWALAVPSLEEPYSNSLDLLARINKQVTE